MTEKLVADMPMLQSWAVNIALDQRASQDFTIIVSPTIAPLILEAKDEASADATVDTPGTVRTAGSRATQATEFTAH